MWDKCEEYTTKVIESGAYALADDYRQNFSADNDYASNKEMIFAWESDGKHTQGYVGVTFIIESSSKILSSYLIKTGITFDGFS